MNHRKKNQPGKIFIISAPSGAGKTTLAIAVRKELRATIPLSKVITYTTRQPRLGEKDGADYHFVSEEKFLELKSGNNFLETNYYNGTWYGSPRSVLDACAHGESFLVVLDPNGARSILNQTPDAVLIWVIPPSMEILRERLVGRSTETPEQIEARLAIAQKELSDEAKSPLFHYQVVNDDLNKATQEIIAIIKKELQDESLLSRKTSSL